MELRLHAVLKTLLFLACCLASCHDYGELQSPTPGLMISTDQELFALITQTQPFTSYALFPNADSVTSGTLNGSTAHQPLVRVSINDTAQRALQNGRLPAGTRFPDGSIILKQIMSGGPDGVPIHAELFGVHRDVVGAGQTILYAVIYKDQSNPLASNGWLWAEFQIDGTPFFSITRKGQACTECHSREQGVQNDFVRTFERQR